jgi:hypothetical protein
MSDQLDEIKIDYILGITQPLRDAISGATYGWLTASRKQLMIDELTYAAT